MYVVGLGYKHRIKKWKKKNIKDFHMLHEQFAIYL
jgi:hypothetical protein